MAALVLCETIQEAYRFADKRGLRRIRTAYTPASIVGSRPDMIYVLPSFEKRRNFHALNAELNRILRKYPQTPIERITEPPKRGRPPKPKPEADDA